MSFLTTLWLPIILSAVAVFIVSSVIHMVLPYHRTDVQKLANEDQVRAAIRTAGVPPGDYAFPHATMKEMGSPEMAAKLNEGPVGSMTIKPNGPIAMTKYLVLWFLQALVISVFVAYLTSHTVPQGTEYLVVFRVAGTAAFLAYSGSQASESIWWGRSWSTTWKNIFDGLIYGLFTAGVFGWLWP